MKPALEHNLEQLSRAIGLYSRAAGLSAEETLAKKGSDVGRELRREWRSLAPARGSIRASRLAALRAGEGVHVRPWVRQWAEAQRAKLIGRVGRKARVAAAENFGPLAGRPLNVQALAVKRELSLREQGRGFLGQAARFLPDSDLGSAAESMARSGPELAEAHLLKFESGPEVTLEFGLALAGGHLAGPQSNESLSVHAVMGILKTRGMAAAARAVANVTADMVPYLERKLGEKAAALGLNS